jgi:hypothetical protein
MMWRILALIASSVKKIAVNPEVRSQIDKAVKMAVQYYKGFRVIQNPAREILVFLTAVHTKADHMTECFMEEIKCPRRFSRSICTKFVEDEFVAIDMQKVVAMHVSGLAAIEWNKPRHQCKLK